MASSAPKRAGAGKEETVFEGYLHDVMQMQTSGADKDYFNCYLQTSQDQYRRCVVFDAKKHGYYVKAAADRKPLKISDAGTIPGKFTPGQLDIRIYYASTEMELKSLDFDYVEKPSITKSVEEALVPESVARQRLEVEQPQMEQGEVEHNTDLDAKKYPMSGPKRGYCLIVNNCDFSSPNLSNRTGTDVDEESLRRVFTWLGFQVEVVQDATRDKMLSSMEKLASRDHSEMDCVACIVLSHGLKGGVYGVDGKVVWLEELTECLNRVQCPSLIEKPKLFFIQANRPARPEVSDQTDRPSGPGVPAQTDGPSSPGVPAQTDGPCSPGDIYSDASVASGSIPSMANLLIVMSSPPSYLSFRDKEKGTWFIQSLCQNLVRLVPRHKDLVSILKEVIRDVTNKTNYDNWRQIPIYTTNMWKLVVFPVPEGPCPSLPTSL